MDSNVIPKRVLIYSRYSGAIYLVKTLKKRIGNEKGIVELQKQIICLAKPMPENTTFAPWQSEWPLKLGSKTSIKYL